MTATTTPKTSTPSKLWRTEDPVLGREKELLKGGMWKHQREFWGLTNFIRVLVGGYGSGKTNTLVKSAIERCYVNAPAPHALVSPTFPVARETTIITMEETLELLGKKVRAKHGGGHFQWRQNKSTNEFRIRIFGRRGRVIIYSGEHPERLKGPNLGSAGIDEPFIQSEDVFKQMLARVRHPKARWKGIDITGTPEQLNWGYELLEGEDRDKYDVGHVVADTRDNKALDEEFAKRLLQGYGEKEAEAYVQGKFVSLSTGLVYYAFRKDRNVVDLPMPEGAELGCGMDFNVDPMAFCVFWVKGDYMHVMEEFELPNADTQFACSVLTEKYPTLKNVYPDPSGKKRATNAPGGVSDFHYIRKAGLTVKARNAAPRRKDRYNAVNGKLKPALGEPMLTLSPKCRKLRKSMLAYSYENMNKPVQKAMSHGLDGLGYAVELLFPVIKSRVQVYDY